MTRQEHAIAAARGERRDELLAMRTEIADRIELLGWRRCRPVIAEVMGLPSSVIVAHGAWWSAVGKRAGPRILAALDDLENSPSDKLF